MKRLTVRVTAEDIAQGIKSDSHNCPIARALRRAGFDHVDVGTFYATVDDERYYLSKRAREFINNFDVGKTVSPLATYFTKAVLNY